MVKRQRIKKYWNEKVVPNRGKIARRVIRVGACYVLTGPSMAVAITPADINMTEVTEHYVAIMGNCFGDTKFGFIPVPTSFDKGLVCAGMLLICAAAAGQNFANVPLDSACVAAMRGVARTTS